MNIRPLDQVSISEVFKEAWQKISGFKGVMWGALIIYFVLTILTNAFNFSLHSHILNFIIVLALYPMSIGLRMMGVKRVRDVEVRVGNVFECYKNFLPLCGIFLLIMLIVFLVALVGMIIGIVLHAISPLLMFVWATLVGLTIIYLAVGFIFAAQLCVDKNLGVIDSLTLSRRKVGQHWFKVFFTYFFCGLLILLSALPLLVGLIWTLPWGYCVLGILYRDLFNS